MKPQDPSPRYSIPRSVFLELSIAGLFEGKRSFRAHALKMMAGIHPPLRVFGKEHIPQAGPGMITVNHYHSPAFWTPWFAASISAQVFEDIHWVMAEAWVYPGLRFGRLYRALSQWMLTRVADVYGFTSMPPMPPDPDEVARRSAAVSRLVSFVRSHPRALIGMAPEGCDQPGAMLGLPPSGFGKLALAFSRKDMPFYPVGIYEEDGQSFLHFGPPYRLEIEAGIPLDQVDLLARRLVMERIAACLPDRLRGEFRAGQPAPYPTGAGMAMVASSGLASR